MEIETDFNFERESSNVVNLGKNDNENFFLLNKIINEKDNQLNLSIKNIDHINKNCLLKNENIRRYLRKRTYFDLIREYRNFTSNLFQRENETTLLFEKLYKIALKLSSENKNQNNSQFKKITGGETFKAEEINKEKNNYIKVKVKDYQFKNKKIENDEFNSKNEKISIDYLLNDLKNVIVLYQNNTTSLELNRILFKKIINSALQIEKTFIKYFSVNKFPNKE